MTNASSRGLRGLAGYLEEMLLQNNTRLCAARLAGLERLTLPDELLGLRREMAKLAPQVTSMCVEIPCFERAGLSDSPAKLHSVEDIPDGLTLGHPKRLSEFFKLYKQYTLRLEITVQNGKASSRIHLKDAAAN